MQGSKYDDAFRENALALCAMPKKTITQVARELGMPRATLYDWVKSAKASDPDYVAVRLNKIRNMMDKAYSVASRSIDGLDKQSKALKLEKSQIDKILIKILSDDGLDDVTRETMAEIVKNYTGASMVDMLKIVKESLAISEKFEKYLSGDEESDCNIQISFADSSTSEMLG